MNFEQRVVIPVSVDRAWSFLADIPAISRCVPGVEEFEVADNSTYRGTLKVNVGPIALRLRGEVSVAERNDAERRSVLVITAADKRISGSVTARSTLTVVPEGDATVLVIHTDASILGKLGEFGQPVMRRKADQIVGEFARNLSNVLADSAAH